MPYEGDYLDDCAALNFDEHAIEAVIVSGEYWNPYGHVLLNCGGEGGIIFMRPRCVAGRNISMKLVSSGICRNPARKSGAVFRFACHTPKPRSAVGKN